MASCTNFFSGFELRYDQNRGEGRSFDIFTPPRQNYSVGERPRPFSDIPALTQLGFYIEDRIAADILGKSVLVQLGARFDNIQPQGLFRGTFGEAISPRLNATVEIIDGIWLRGGFGVTVKSPTLSQLYPDRKYFDLVASITLRRILQSGSS